MTNRSGYVCSTIGRKQLMAVAGLGLCIFVLAHVAGNFLLFVGPEAYNMYSHKLTSNPLIYIAEVGLLVLIITHILASLIITLRNWSARKTRYAKAASGDKATSKTSKTLWWQGVVILVFVVLHLITFKYGQHYEVTYDGVVVRDLFRLVAEVFTSPVYVIWYVVAVAILGFHLAHGLHSSIQTLGFNHPSYRPKILVVSFAYGLFIGLGFMAQPLYMFFVYRG